MLDHKSQLSAAETKPEPTRVRIYVDDARRDSVVLVLPSADEVKLLSDGFVPAERTRAESDILQLRAEAAAARVVEMEEKQERFKDSRTYWTRLAQLNELAGDALRAKSILSERVKLDGWDFYKYELGALFLDGELDDSSRKMFNSCDLSSDINANLRLAQICIRQNRYEEAGRYVSTALSIDPVDYRSRMMYGAWSLWNGSWDQAIRSFRVALKTRVSSVLYVNLAVAYCGNDDLKKASRALRVAHHIDPSDSDAARFLADVLLPLNRYQDAANALELTLKLRPDEEGLLGMLGWAYLRAGSINKNDRKSLQRSAQAYAAQAGFISSNASSAWNNVGVAFARQKRILEAKKYFTQAYVSEGASSKSSLTALGNLLTSLIELRDYKTARTLVKGFFGLNSLDQPLSRELSKLALNYIIVLEATGSRLEAAEYAEKFLNAGVDNAETELEILAHLFYYRTDVAPDKEIVLKFIPRILNILRSGDGVDSTSMPRALNNVVYALLMFDEVSQASEFVPAATKFKGVDPYICATLGLYLIKIGHFEAAEKAYREAMAMVRDRALSARFQQKMNLEVGRAKLKAGSPFEARRHLTLATNENNGLDFYREEARRLRRDATAQLAT